LIWKLWDQWQSHLEDLQEQRMHSNRESYKGG
jgi:hypothetical protein